MHISRVDLNLLVVLDTIYTEGGITKAAELPRRFYDRDSGYVSVRARPVAR